MLWKNPRSIQQKSGEIVNPLENKHASFLLYLSSLKYIFFKAQDIACILKCNNHIKSLFSFHPHSPRGRSVILLSFLHNYELWIQIFRSSFEILSQKHSYVAVLAEHALGGQCGGEAEVLFLVKVSLKFCSGREVYWREDGCPVTGRLGFSFAEETHYYTRVPFAICKSKAAILDSSREMQSFIHYALVWRIRTSSSSTDYGSQRNCSLLLK